VAFALEQSADTLVAMITPMLSAALSLLAAGQTFTNPVVPNGEDPWVIKHDGMYYYLWASGPGHMNEFSSDHAVWVRGSKSLVGVFNEPLTAQAWRPEPGKAYSKELWAPELHYLDGAWYIYVAADDGRNETHKMHVLRRKDADPRGPFEHVGELKLPDDKWAIDATVFTIDGQLYCVWSGWPGEKNVIQNLYICKMKNPITPIGERVMISSPELPWEKIPNVPDLPLINEGPTGFQLGDKTFITYAASGSWSDAYCIGLLELTGKDAMDAKSWTKHDKPLLATGNGMVAPGHASVVKSPDDKEWWLVFHTAKRPGAGWDRQVNIRRLTIDSKTGAPVIDVADEKAILLPSGEKK
jgi:GH43 family beta-xylosidase